MFDIFLIIRNNNEKITIIKNINIILIEGNGDFLTDNLIKTIKKKNIDILIYQYKYKNEMNRLIKLDRLKIIFINHSCFLLWIYTHNYNMFSDIYDIYKKSKYVVSIVPFENNFLFKKWGINSIYMNNFISYDYDKIQPSSLSENIILMLGSANVKSKRFYLGIKSMKYIVQEITDCVMKIISNTFRIENLKLLINSLNLGNYVKFVGYSKSPEIYFNNASLHIFPTISEAFPMALCETKIYGIPNIITGIDYISAFEGGIINIYDDKPESIAKESIKILKNEKYRKNLGNQARLSMKKFDNHLTLEKWIKLILSVYKGETFYQRLVNEVNKGNNTMYINLLNNQLKLLKIREPITNKISFKNILDFNFMKNISYILKY